MRRAPPAPRGGPGRVSAGPGRGRRHLHPPPLPARPGPSARRVQPGTAGRGCYTAGRPTARDPPGHAAAAATLPRARRPTRPPSLRTRLHTTGFTHSADGREDSPGEVAATIFASPAVGSCARLPTRPRLTTTPRPRARGVRPARPAKGLGEGREARPRGGGRPHPPGLARGREVARRRGSGGGGSTSKDHVGE